MERCVRDGNRSGVDAYFRSHKAKEMITFFIRGRMGGMESLQIADSVRLMTVC
jgi:hypothetical protein